MKKQLFFFIILALSLRKSMQFFTFSSGYQKFVYYELITQKKDSSLIQMFQANNLLNCLAKCNSIEKCFIVFYLNINCILYNESASILIYNKNSEYKIYKKIQI